MSSTIERATIQQFSDNILMLSQQKGSRLRGLVRDKAVKAAFYNFDRIGATTAQQLTSRHQDTPLIEGDHTRRRVSFTPWAWATLLDEQDDVELLADPTSEYAMSGAYAIGRAMDDAILEAATGNATSVTAKGGAGAGSNVALPSGQIIDEDFNTANPNLIVEKLIEAKRILLANNVDVKNEELYIAVNASAHASLLNENQLQSRDFKTMPALVDGTIVTGKQDTFSFN